MTRIRKILKRGGRRKSRRFRNMRGGLQCNLNSHQPPWLTGLDFVNNRIKAHNNYRISRIKKHNTILLLLLMTLSQVMPTEESTSLANRTNERSRTDRTEHLDNSVLVVCSFRCHDLLNSSNIFLGPRT